MSTFLDLSAVKAEVLRMEKLTKFQLSVLLADERNRSCVQEALVRYCRIHLKENCVSLQTLRELSIRRHFKGLFSIYMKVLEERAGAGQGPLQFDLEEWSRIKGRTDNLVVAHNRISEYSPLQFRVWTVEAERGALSIFDRVIYEASLVNMCTPKFWNPSRSFNWYIHEYCLRNPKASGDFHG